MKKDAYYFSHDSNAQDDPKCMLLIDQLGMEGYGIFWGLIEKLRAEKDYKLPISVASAFARRWCTSKEKIETVILKFGLFKVENENFFSIRLTQSMLEKSEKARASISHRWNNKQITDNTNVYDRIRSNTDEVQANTTDIRNDTIKGKENKGKENKEEKKENKEKKVENFEQSSDKYPEYPDDEAEYEEKYQTRLGKIDPAIKKLFLSFCKERECVHKKPVTARSGYYLLGDLWELSKTPEIQRKVIEQAISRGYQSFYPVPGSNNPNRELNSSERLPYLN